MAETATTPATENTAAAPQTATENAGNTEAAQHEENNGNLEKLIQQAVDRATNKLGNENKKLRGEIDTLKKANMDADEVKKFELSEKEKELAERAKELTDRENRLFAIKAIKQAGLDNGDENSLAIVDFVMADTEEGITERVKAFDTLIKRLVQTEVDKVFRANGRTPGVGSDSTAATGTKTENSLAVNLGRNAAQANKAAQNVLNHYLGGK